VSNLGECKFRGCKVQDFGFKTYFVHTNVPFLKCVFKLMLLLPQSYCVHANVPIPKTYFVHTNAPFLKSMFTLMFIF